MPDSNHPDVVLLHRHKGAVAVSVAPQIELDDPRLTSIDQIRAVWVVHCDPASLIALLDEVVRDDGVSLLDEGSRHIAPPRLRNSDVERSVGCSSAQQVVADGEEAAEAPVEVAKTNLAKRRVIDNYLEERRVQKQLNDYDFDL